MEWPPIWLLFCTYKRTQTALEVIESHREKLEYPNLHWHVCDDGSRETDDGTDRWHVGVLLDAIGTDYGPITYHEMDTPPGEFNMGGNINRGIWAMRQSGAEIYLLILDDCKLMSPIDLRPFVDVLDYHKEIGWVRLWYPAEGLAGVFWRYDTPRLGGKQHTWIRLIREWSRYNPWWADSFLVSMGPALVHNRFHEAYGLYAEHLVPGETEVDIMDRYNSSPLGEDGPQIVIHYGEWPTTPWAHIDGRQNAYKEWTESH